MCKFCKLTTKDGGLGGMVFFKISNKYDDTRVIFYFSCDVNISCDSNESRLDR
jgi:hypothetical protein